MEWEGFSMELRGQGADDVHEYVSGVLVLFAPLN